MWGIYEEKYETGSRFCIVIMVLCFPDSVFACGSCYGAADSPATNGMNFAILSMIGITGGVLAAITSFFLYLRKRAQIVPCSRYRTSDKR